MRFFLLSAALLACTPKNPKTSTPATAEAAKTPERPTMAVLIVVDQLSMRLLNAPKERYAHGLARLTGPEASVQIAHYSHAITYTCPGHATISTGAAPSVTGIVSNDWWIPSDEGGTEVYCADAALLRAEALADRVIDAGGKVASVALKDRSAIMLGGHRPTLVSWYDRKQGDLTHDLQGAVELAPFLTPYEALYPDDYARWVGPDDGEREQDPGLGTTFPHLAPTAGNFLYAPQSGDYLVDAALIAVERAGFGQDAIPDLLTLSFSQTDYIAHAYTTESWEAMDAMVKLDRSIGRLLEGLETRFGKGRIDVFLTSDHGSTVAEGVTRIPLDAVSREADAALAALGIPGAVKFESPSLWLPNAVRNDPEQRAKAARAVADAVAAIDGIEAAYPWRDEPVTGPHAEAVMLSLDPERSGDVYVLRGANALYDYLGGEGKGTSHGTPFSFDTDVPFLAFGPNVAARQGPMVDVRQIAPTVAAALGVPAPADADQPVVDGFFTD